jgi:hypothetical protein
LAYQKQTFKDNETVLKAEHLNHIEDGIVALENTMNDSNGVSIPNGAAVGQIIQVSAVDESGQPTEWTAVDMPSGVDEEKVKEVVEEYLSNNSQTAATLTIYEPDGQTVAAEFDGSENKSVTLPSGGGSSATLTIYEADGKTVAAEYDGTEAKSITLPAAGSSGGSANGFDFDNIETLAEITYTEETQVFYTDVDFTKYVAVLVTVDNNEDAGSCYFGLNNDSSAYALRAIKIFNGLTAMVVPFGKRWAFVSWNTGKGEPTAGLTASVTYAYNGLYQSVADFTGIKIHNGANFKSGDKVCVYGVKRGVAE